MKSVTNPTPSVDPAFPLEPAWRYGSPAIALHWLLALLIAGMLAVGWYMVASEDDPGAGWYFDMHKSFGLVVAALVAARIAWRATHAPAALPSSVPALQVRLAHVTQWLLYALMVLMPLTGYLGAAFSKRGVAFFGAATPRWAMPQHSRSEQFFSLHSVLAWAMVALVALHVLGALKHVWIDRDSVFRRMRL